MFGKKTVDQVIAAFDKARTDLLVVADSLTAEANDKRKKSAEIAREAEAAASEADRAKRIAERVTALVS